MAGPLFVVHCGLPGVGKSTVSAYTARQLDARRYRNDEVRKDLFDEPTYTAEETRRTYEELLDRARADLVAGEDVVVDATFTECWERDLAAEVATETGARVTLVHVTCPRAVVRERIRERTDDPSDADLAVYERLRAEFEPLERDHVTVDNGGSLAATRTQVDERVLDAADGEQQQSGDDSDDE